MLAAMTGAMVVAGANRVMSAKRVLAERTDIGAFILDDAFQHLRVKRDLNVLLVSAAAPWGRADHVMRCLPGGLMREPLAAARRADVVVITRADQLPPGRAEEITAVLRKVGVCAPILRGAHAVMGLRSSARGAGESCDLPVSWLTGRRVVAVCGIGEPGSFVKQLEGLGAEVVRVVERVDHHRFGAADVAEISAAATADGVVTTEKDWVKLAALPLPAQVTWVRMDVRMAMLSDGAVAFGEMLRQRLKIAGRGESG
jgi:tetraacyldisaccharide 4'-kinase